MEGLREGGRRAGPIAPSSGAWVSATHAEKTSTRSASGNAGSTPARCAKSACAHAAPRISGAMVSNRRGAVAGNSFGVSQPGQRHPHRAGQRQQPRQAFEHDQAFQAIEAVTWIGGMVEQLDQQIGPCLRTRAARRDGQGGGQPLPATAQLRPQMARQVRRGQHGVRVSRQQIAQYRAGEFERQGSTGPRGPDRCKRQAQGGAGPSTHQKFMVNSLPKPFIRD